MKTARIRFLSILSLLSLLLAAQDIHTVYAATYIVNSLEDNIIDDGVCTLREAILAANNAPVNTNCGPGSSTDDMITFSVSGTIVLSSTLPVIVSTQGAITIDGGEKVTISGNRRATVLDVDRGASLSLRNLTIADGSGGFGGGVRNYGTLRVTNCVFTGNESGGFGGGIYNHNFSTLMVTNSTFSRNEARYGGGIYNQTYSNLTVTDSTFYSNYASWGGGGGIGGYGTMTVTNSAFISNGATWGTGGGIFNSGTLTVINSTFAGNYASQFGGGIHNKSDTSLPLIARLTINNSTFSQNDNGIYIESGIATIRNTIIANSYEVWDCAGILSSTSNNNIIEDSVNACGLENGINGNIIGFDPNLGALTGSPAYFPLNPGSLAINAGDNATCAATDQRGVARPQGGACDIGAFEAILVHLPLVLR